MVRCLHALFAQVPSLANRMTRNEMASSRLLARCLILYGVSLRELELLSRSPYIGDVRCAGRSPCSDDPAMIACIPSPDCRWARRVLGGLRWVTEPGTATDRVHTTAVSTIGPVARAAPSRATWRWPGSWRHEPPMMTTCGLLPGRWNGRGRIELREIPRGRSRDPWHLVRQVFHAEDAGDAEDVTPAWAQEWRRGASPEDVGL
jgi:hypothetical protein